MRPMLGALAILSFIITFAATRVLLSRFGRFALDTPNERSLHERPVPRTGGIAVVAGIAAASLLVTLMGTALLWLPMALALLLAGISFMDDVRALPTAARLAAHFAAATVLVWYVLSPMHPGMQALLAISVAWITNLYNFMDGSDGLAAGMGVAGFGAYAVAASLAGDAALAALSLATAAACAGFLPHNYHPARIFLGDVGSIPLGFLAGALGVVGWRNDAWPLWFPVLVFGPFIGDATITLLKRLVRRERLWQAHREHYYQRMVRMGLGHRGTAFVVYGAMLVCAAAALLGRTQAPAMQGVAFAAASLVLGALALWVDLRWARFTRDGGQAA
jgi:UDP-N-acetylmuramyl pentapeptide phosphotransferase/UDP-N-acetylglucosamine-1-phosphate transferase